MSFGISSQCPKVAQTSGYRHDAISSLDTLLTRCWAAYVMRHLHPRLQLPLMRQSGSPMVKGVDERVRRG
jgi:hypothetical protein